MAKGQDAAWVVCLPVWSASPAVVALLLIVASCCCTPLEVVGGGEVPEFQVLLHDPDEVAGVWLWLISVPALWGVVSGWKTSVCVVSLSVSLSSLAVFDVAS